MANIINNNITHNHAKSRPMNNEEKDRFSKNITLPENITLPDILEVQIRVANSSDETVNYGKVLEKIFRDASWKVTTFYNSYGFCEPFQGVKIGIFPFLEDVFPFLKPEWEESQVKKMMENEEDPHTKL